MSTFKLTRVPILTRSSAKVIFCKLSPAIFVWPAIVNAPVSLSILISLLKYHAPSGLDGVFFHTIVLSPSVDLKTIPPPYAIVSGPASPSPVTASLILLSKTCNDVTSTLNCSPSTVKLPVIRQSPSTSKVY